MAHYSPQRWALKVWLKEQPDTYCVKSGFHFPSQDIKIAKFEASRGPQQISLARRDGTTLHVFVVSLDFGAEFDTLHVVECIAMQRIPQVEK